MVITGMKEALALRWFTADTHFGHENIIRYSGRPFTTVAEMNESLVRRYNDAVRPRDDVWWLGDVVMGNAEANLGLVAECRGVKTLVVGNHDRVFADPQAKHGPNPRWKGLYQGAGFETIIHRNTTIRLANNVTVVLCHFPYVGDSHDEDRFTDSRATDRGQWLLHGHVHDKWRQHGRQINVGVDAWGGRPTSEAEVCALIDAGPRDLDPLAW